MVPKSKVKNLYVDVASIYYLLSIICSFAAS